MNKAIQSILENCTEPELMRDPDCWMWLTEMRASLNGDDLKDSETALLRMREKRARPEKLRTIHHCGLFDLEEIDDSFEQWFVEHGYRDIGIYRRPEEGWFVSLFEDGTDSFRDLVDSSNAIYEKFDEFGGEYCGWSFVGRFMVAHRVTEK